MLNSIQQLPQFAGFSVYRQLKKNKTNTSIVSKKFNEKGKVAAKIDCLFQLNEYIFIMFMKLIKI